jgi:DNA-binding transcriptional LysR family regulator
MDRFEAMSMLLTAIDKGSLSAAAREMRVPVPTLSRKVAELESLLGTRLLIRTTRTLMLTDAGVAYVAAARRILEDVEEAEREAAGEFQTPRGTLVITAPHLFGRMFVLPIVADFLALFPEIDVRLMLDDRYLNLVDEHIDMAVRLGNLPDSDLIATRIGTMRMITCATPAFLNGQGIPRTIEDLQKIPCLLNKNQTALSGWRLRDPKTGGVVVVPLAPRLASSNEAIAEAALLGIGLANLPYYQAYDALADGRLQPVLEEFEAEAGPIHLVHAAQGKLPLKMRRFLDFAVPRIRAQVTRFGPAPSAAPVTAQGNYAA